MSIDSIGSAVVALLVDDTQFARTMQQVVKTAYRAAENIETAFNGILDSTSFSGIMSAIGTLTGAFVNISKAIGGTIGAIVSTLAGVGPQIGASIGAALFAIPGNLLQSFISITGAIASTLASIVSSIGSLITTIATTAYNAISSAINAIAGAIYSVFSALAGSIARIFEYAAGTLLADFIRSATSQMKAFVDEGINANAEFEKLKVSLSVMLGTMGRAKRLFGDLARFAAETPFELPGLARSVQMLASTRKIAEEDLLPTIRKLGDAAASSTLGFEAMPQIVRAITDMFNKGKIQAQEMTVQLANAGIPAWDILAKKMHKSVTEVQALSKAGKLAHKEIKLLIDGMGERFSGMMLKQSRTYEGLMSTIRDNTRLAVAGIFEPVFEMTKKGAIALVDMFNNAAFKSAVAGVTLAVKTIADSVTKLGDELKKAFSASFGSSAGQLKADIIRIWEVSVSLGQNFREMVIPALNDAAKAFQSVFGNGAGAVDTIVAVGKEIATLTADWSMMFTHARAVTREYVAYMGDLMRELLNNAIPNSWTALVTFMKDFFVSIADVMGKYLYAVLVDAFQRIVLSTLNMFVVMTEAVGKMLSSMLLRAAVTLAKIAAQTAALDFQGAGGSAMELAVGLTSDIGGSISESVKKAMAISVPELYKDAGDASNALPGKTKSMLGDLGAGITNAFSGLGGIQVDTSSSTSTRRSLEAEKAKDDKKRAKDKQADDIMAGAAGWYTAISDFILDKITPKMTDGQNPDAPEKKKGEKAGFVGVTELSKKIQSSLDGDKDKTAKDTAIAAKATSKNTAALVTMFGPIGNSLATIPGLLGFAP